MNALDKKIKPLRALAEKWPSAIVARSEVKSFSGGVLNPGTLANLDCLGRGPAGRFKIGKKTVYSVESLVQFMSAMAEPPILESDDR